MTAPWASLGGERVLRARVQIPGIGAWYAEVEMEGAPSLTGRHVLELGALRLAGTIDETASGTSALVATYRLVAGAGGWSRELAARAYHSDAGVRASTVAQDAAREAGESLGAMRIPSDALGADYVRSRGAASVTLADIAAGTPWWVDYDGVTHVEPRAESDASADAYEVLEVDAAQRLVTLAVDDLTRIGIGSVLRARLDAPLTVRSMEVEIDAAGSVRVRAWCGAPAATASRLARDLSRIVQHVTAERLLGVWSYQVVRQAGARLELQPVARGAGLPDIGPVDVWTGVAGATTEVEPGTRVLVEFVDGDRRQPIVRGFAPKGGSGHVPRTLLLDASAASASIVLGDGATKPLAYAEDVARAFADVKATIDGFIPGSGGAEFPVPFLAPTASALGTRKVVAR